MYEHFKTFTLEKLIHFYEKRGNALMYAKSILEKDCSYVSRERDQKRTIITLLEETSPHMKSAKQHYDENKYNLAKEELRIVLRRLWRVNNEITSFPYRDACPVEEIIIREYAKINDLFQYILSG